MNRRLFITLGATTLLLCACGAREETAREEVRPVRVTVAGRGAVTPGATFAGEIRARHESRLGFQASGRIVSRLVEIGAHVRRGQELMRLDPAQESLHLVAASADVDAARSRVLQNRVDLDRAEQLLARQFASPAEVDQQRLALAQAESQLKSALAQQELMRNQRNFTVLEADRDGVITALNVEAGQVVSAGQPVLTLAADGEREVLISIPESRIEELRAAATLEVWTWASPLHRFSGELRELAPDADDVTRTYAARIRVLAPDAALRLGMTAAVRLADIADRSAIRLPLSAVRHRDGEALVWIVDGATGRVEPRAICLGNAHDEDVLVLRGLEGGEIVVTAGTHMLHDGQRVIVVPAPDLNVGIRL